MKKMTKLILLLGLGLIMGACNTERADVVYNEKPYKITMEMEEQSYKSHPGPFLQWPEEKLMGLYTELKYTNKKIGGWFTPIKKRYMGKV